MLRILIVDDQRLLSEGLQTIINLEPDMEVVGTAEDGADAVKAAVSLEPDVVLMDVRMPVMDGIEALKRIKRERPQTIVLILTSYAEEKFIVEGMAMGADGFLLKDMSAEQIVGTIRDSVSGNLILPASVASKLAARLMALSDNRQGELDERKLEREGIAFTESERKIVLLLVQGLSNKQIASKLFMSTGTVRNYISVIYTKLGTSDRETAVLRIRELLLP